MAHDIAHDTHASGSDAAALGITHAYPSARTYILVGAVLTMITAVEVWIYYIPSIVASRAFVPSLLIMSAVKFVTVVLFYMHLRYDHKLFRVLFFAPLLIAALTILGLMFLLGPFTFRIGS
jgi:cytochrome c oxidase subunit IV